MVDSDDLQKASRWHIGRFRWLVLVAFAMMAVFEGGIPCLFKSLWGISCPGCGMTRSLIALSQGDWLLSLRFHPLGIPFVALSMWVMFQALTGRMSRARALFGQKRAQWVILGVLLSIYIFRHLSQLGGLTWLLQV